MRYLVGVNIRKESAMKEELEIIEDAETAAEADVIVSCRRELLRLAIYGTAIVLGVNLTMAGM